MVTLFFGGPAGPIFFGLTLVLADHLVYVQGNGLLVYLRMV